APVRAERLKGAIGMFPKEAQDAIFAAPEQRTPMQWQMYYRSASRLPSDTDLEKYIPAEVGDRYGKLLKELAEYEFLKPADPPVAETMRDSSRNAPPTFLLSKGVWDAPVNEVQPGFLSILDSATPAVSSPDGIDSTGRRSVLARWLSSPKNPLTARV